MKRTPLRRGAPLRRKQRLRARNDARREVRFLRAYESPARVLWTRGCGCVVTGCRSTRIEVTHVRSRGAGGTADDTVAMCRDHHRELHRVGTLVFEARHRLDLADLAAQHALRWRQGSQPRAA
ncbi:MAG: hypothetical protein M0R75_01600 [Dehalococcoidia bacterium]|nr:hypothetical protein [Dehalococcoidia bacterium]